MSRLLLTGAKNMNDYTDSILKEHYHDIAALAALAGINWNEAQHKLVFNDKKINPPSIALDKNYRGKSAMWAKKDVDRHGNLFPFIRFNSFKSSPQVFNGKATFYRAKERGGFLKPSTDKQIAKHQARIAESKQDEASHEQWKNKQLDDVKTLYGVANGDIKTHKHFVDALANCNESDRVAFNEYLSKLSKTVRRANYTQKNVVLDVLICPIQDHHGIITGFQLIADKAFNNDMGNKKFVGKTKGGYLIIGGIVPNKAIGIAEGLKTGLVAAVASGLPVVVCFSAGNMPPVANHFKNHRLNIFSDNDHKNDKGNTGIFVALKTASLHGNARIFKAVCDGTDYADLLKEQDLNAVKTQLAIRKNSVKNKEAFEIKLKKDAIAQALQLLEFVIVGNEKPVIEQACKEIADIFYTNLSDSVVAQRKLDKLIKARGFSAFDTDEAITEIIDAKQCRVKKRNCITDGKTTKIDIAGLSFQEVVQMVLALILSNAVIVDARGMATGKTELMAALIAALEKHLCCFIAPLVSIVGSVSTTTGLTNYEKVNPREWFGNLAICSNSVAKFQINRRFKHFFFDEFRQMHAGILINPEMRNRIGVFNEISEIIKNHESSAYFADADTNNDTIDFIASCTDRTIYEIIDSSLPKLNGKKIRVMDCDLKTAMLRGVAEIQKGKKVFFTTDNKEFATEIHDTLEALVNGRGEIETGILSADNANEITRLSSSLLIHSDNKGDKPQADFLDNPNAQIIYYCSIVASPVIQSGFSIKTPHIDVVYSLLSGGTITPNVAIQSIARCRTVTDIYMAFEPQKHTDRLTDYEMLERGEIECRADLAKAMREMIGDFDVLSRATILEDATFSFNDFDKLAFKERVAKNIEMSDFANNVLMLAELKGYHLDYVREVPQAAELTEKDKQDIQETKEKRNHYIATLPKALQIEDATQAARIRLQNPTTEISNALLNWDTRQMSGSEKPTVEDVKNCIDGKAATLANFESITQSDKTLLLFDADHKILTRDKSTSKYKKATLFREVLAQLVVLSSAEEKPRKSLLRKLRKTHAEYDANADKQTHTLALKKAFNRLDDAIADLKKPYQNLDDYHAMLVAKANDLKIDADMAEIICFNFKANAGLMAVNGLGNHTTISKQPIKTLANVAARFGFDCTSFKQKGTEENRTRIYKISINPTIKTYSENRKKNEQKNKPENAAQANNDEAYDQPSRRTHHNDIS